MVSRMGKYCERFTVSFKTHNSHKKIEKVGMNGPILWMAKMKVTEVN